MGTVLITVQKIIPFRMNPYDELETDGVRIATGTENHRINVKKRIHNLKHQISNLIFLNTLRHYFE